MTMTRRKQDTEWFRDVFDESYPSLYGHRDIAEARALLEQLSRLLPAAGGRVLDVGCGPGRYLSALAERGMHPVGVDLSLPLLLHARQLLAGVPLVRADMRSLPFRAGRFRLILLMFTTFGYFSSDEEDAPGPPRRCLACWTRRGDSSSTTSTRRIFADTSWNHRAGARGPAPSRKSDGSTRRGRFLHKESRVASLTGGEERVYRERLRLYEPAQIEAMLEDAGFAIVEKWGDYQGGPFDPSGSARYLAIARRGEGHG